MGSICYRRGFGVAVSSILDVAGDVLTAASALAGLTLIFLAANVSRFESYPAFFADIKLRKRFRRKSWLVFIGFAFAIVAALLSLLGKLLHSECTVLLAVVVFVLGLLWVTGSAVAMVLEIKIT
jgi:hypothetical protein